MRIFINYRRDDEANIAFAIANSLMKEFGVENVFFDRQAIRASAVFTKEIDSALNDCFVFITIIGKKWMDILRRRQKLSETDYVLLELEKAISKGVIILPVLLDDTLMPSESDLPEKVRLLSLINAVNISTNPVRLPSDMKVLISELDEILSKPSQRRLAKKWIKWLRFTAWSVGIIAALIVIIIVVRKIRRTDPIGDNEPIPVMVEEEDLPLSRDEFRSKVLTTAMLMKTDPLDNSASHLSKLEELNDIEKSFKFYAEEMTTETAIFKRLYGASILINGQDPKISPSTYFKKAIIHIRRSYSLDPEIWKETFEKETFDFFMETEKIIGEVDFTDKKFIAQYLKHMLTAAMFNASEEEIDEQVTKLLGDVFSLSEVLEFFLNYPVGDSKYRYTIEAIKLLLISMGGELEGPEIVNPSRNIYQIKYWLFDSNDVKKFVIWEVDMKRKEVTPYNADAKMFTDAIKNKK